MKLDSQNVQDIFFKCLFNDNESKENYKEAHGIQLRVGFKPENLEFNKADIVDMLNQLPLSFHSNSGGGFTFLNLCETATGEQWTSEHRIMDQLLCLGIAINKMEILLPRNMWAMFPGGMPYVCVKNEE